MLNTVNATRIQMTQPLFFEWLQNEAIREITWFAATGNQIKGSEFSRFHEKLLEKKIIEKNLGSNVTFDDDLESLANFDYRNVSGF